MGKRLTATTVAQHVDPGEGEAAAVGLVAGDATLVAWL